MFVVNVVELAIMKVDCFYGKTKEKGVWHMETNSMEVIAQKMKKDLMINRVVSSITMGISIIILIIVIVIGVRVGNFLEVAQPVFDELAQIDMEALNESLKNFNDIMDTFHFQEIKETLDNIDFEGLNDMLNGMDIDELTETLDNINEGANTLNEISDWFKESPLNIFGLGNN